MSDDSSEYRVILSTGAVLAARAVRDTGGGGLQVWLPGTPTYRYVTGDKWYHADWQPVPSDFTLGPSTWVAYRRTPA